MVHCGVNQSNNMGNNYWTFCEENKWDKWTWICTFIMLCMILILQSFKVYHTYFLEKPANQTTMRLGVESQQSSQESQNFSNVPTDVPDISEFESRQQ